MAIRGASRSSTGRPRRNAVSGSSSAATPPPPLEAWKEFVDKRWNPETRLLDLSVRHSSCPTIRQSNIMRLLIVQGRRRGPQRTSAQHARLAQFQSRRHSERCGYTETRRFAQTRGASSRLELRHLADFYQRCCRWTLAITNSTADIFSISAATFLNL